MKNVMNKIPEDAVEADFHETRVGR